MIQPRSNHFAGKIFVLMNGGSFSATAMVIATLEREKRAVFIGEKTGGNRHIISGDPIEEVLPSTKMRCFISTTNYRIVAGDNDGHGISPTFPVHPSIDDMLKRYDASKAMALKLISDDHSSPGARLPNKDN
jgi:C-terminal processing protease CtpA/Prc